MLSQYQFIINFSDGETVQEAYLRAGQTLGVTHQVTPGDGGQQPLANGLDTTSEDVQDAEDVAPPTRRRRAREAAPVEQPKTAADPGELRTKSVDILRKCWDIKAEKVIALQKEVFHVDRFSEVPDSRAQELYDAAIALRDELATAPPADTAGPFWLSPF